MEISQENFEWLCIVDKPYKNTQVDSMLSIDFSDIVRHGILVSNLSLAVARLLGEDEQLQREVSIAGLVHDIGKLKLGRYLYGRKKDSLNIEEMKYVRMHPTFSYNILKGSGKFSENILKAVYSHHENYDGSGYPNNLKGEDIPLMARIIRTCDVFAALVSQRPYRAAFEIETAMDLMIDEVKNFDMKIFLAFQQLVNSQEFDIIRAKIKRFNQIHEVAASQFETGHPINWQEEAV